MITHTARITKVLVSMDSAGEVFMERHLHWIVIAARKLHDWQLDFGHQDFESDCPNTSSSVTLACSRIGDFTNLVPGPTDLPWARQPTFSDSHKMTRWGLQVYWGSTVLSKGDRQSDGDGATPMFATRCVTTHMYNNATSQWSELFIKIYKASVWIG